MVPLLNHAVFEGSSCLYGCQLARSQQHTASPGEKSHDEARAVKGDAQRARQQVSGRDNGNQDHGSGRGRVKWDLLDSDP
jgi:hypothetical protein